MDHPVTDAKTAAGRMKAGDSIHGASTLWIPLSWGG